MTNIFDEYKKMTLDETYNKFMKEYNDDQILIKHRSYVEINNLGYGERPFHAMWRELIKIQPDQFKFLEIGVYKGQILSLVKLLSDVNNKVIDYYGITPLTNEGDKYSTYENVNYGNIISNLFENFNLDFNINKNILNGLSTDEDIKNKIIDKKFFDLIYIDGGHDYDCVVSDINLMIEISKVGSYIVFDDSSCFKKIDNVKFKGHLDVCNAIKDVIENNELFVEVLCVGHNRVFKRVK